MNDARPIRLRSRHGDAPPVYTLEVVPGVLPVGTMRFGSAGLGIGRAVEHTTRNVQAHSHDFLVLAYFERAGGSLWLGGSERPVAAGDAFVIAPGVIVDAGSSGLAHAEGWAVFFPPEVLGPAAPGPLLSWRAHPLLFPFARGAADGALHLRVPPADRPVWSQRMGALDRELERRRDGYREAVVAYLTLLLVDVSRLSVDIASELRFRDEPLLAEVFGYIEEHYREPMSLRQVAEAVALSPGHLTTVVRRKTGRPVQEWIAERRLAEARRLLVETDLSVQEIGRRVGYADPSYFGRLFKRAFGTTPLGWRRAGRP